MLLTLMMNLGMFAPSVPIVPQIFPFDSKLEGQIQVDGSQTALGFDSTNEGQINVTGNENTFRFDSKITTVI